MNATLTREERLRSKRTLERLFAQGHSGFAYPFRYVYLTAEETAAANVTTTDTAADCRPAKVLFSVPKRFHKRANKRNLLRRRTKEAYRLNKGMLVDGGVRAADIALIYSVKEVVEYKRIENAVKRIMSQIVAGVQTRGRDAADIAG